MADEFHCSFCGKSRREVKKLISGPKVFVCDECISLCTAIIAEETSRDVAISLLADAETPTSTGDDAPTLDDVIASRTVGFHPFEGDAVEFTIKIGRPQFAKDAGWCCPYEIGGLGATVCDSAAATTSVQALIFALQSVGGALEEIAQTAQGRFHWGDEFPFPRFQK